MVISEADLRSQLKCPSWGASIVVPQGAKLTPAAHDFVTQWRLVLVDEKPSEPAAPDAGLAAQSGTGSKAAVKLNAGQVVAKTHRRIKLRTRIDSLLAFVRLTQRMAKQEGQHDLVRDIGLIAEHLCDLAGAEFGERPVDPLVLPDWSWEQICQVIADPAANLGIEHPTIDENEIELMHWLSVVRTQVAEVEIYALEAFETSQDDFGDTICQAFERLGVVLYFLQLRLKAEGMRA